MRSAISSQAVAEIDAIGVIVRLAKVLEIVLADMGLTMNQFRLLTLVQEASPSKAELSLRLVMKPPNVTVLTSGLVKRGLLTERRPAHDGRRRTLELTKAGTRALAAAHKRCGVALRFLAKSSPSGNQLFASLERWLPALDAAAVELRKLVSDHSSAGDSITRRSSRGRTRSTLPAPSRT